MKPRSKPILYYVCNTFQKFGKFASNFFENSPQKEQTKIFFNLSIFFIKHETRFFLNYLLASVYVGGLICQWSLNKKIKLILRWNFFCEKALKINTIRKLKLLYSTFNDVDDAVKCRSLISCRGLDVLWWLVIKCRPAPKKNILYFYIFTNLKTNVKFVHSFVIFHLILF